MTSVPATWQHHDMLMTRDGYDRRLRAELERLATVDRGELADRLRNARQETGEPRENSELLDALQESVRLERRIRLLEERLSSAEIADGAAAEGFVTVGSRVRLRLLRERRVLEYEVVGAGEADPSRGGYPRSHRWVMRSSAGVRATSSTSASPATACASGCSPSNQPWHRRSPSGKGAVPWPTRRLRERAPTGDELLLCASES